MERWDWLETLGRLERALGLLGQGCGRRWFWAGRASRVEVDKSRPADGWRYQDAPSVARNGVARKPSAAKAAEDGEVSLEMLSQVHGFKGCVELDSPGRVFGCVEAFARIVLSKPAFEIGRMAAETRMKNAEEGADC